jgi:hypothetical protein
MGLVDTEKSVGWWCSNASKMTTDREQIRAKTKQWQQEKQRVQGEQEQQEKQE